MATTSVAVAIRNNRRTALRTAMLVPIMLVTIYLFATWTNDLLGASIRTALPKRTMASKANRSRAPRFVSQCSSNFDRRRLGNQLFNWAAMLYVARLTGRLVPSYTHMGVDLL